tara:strand:- start:637 stop:825 length:189 start_codon:yes stop_codon:yes gene_type:complete
MKSEELNPVSKARLIVDAMTKDVFIANKLLTGMTRNLTVEQINELFDEVTIINNQLKLNLKL